MKTSYLNGDNGIKRGYHANGRHIYAYQMRYNAKQNHNLT